MATSQISRESSVAIFGVTSVKRTKEFSPLQHAVAGCHGTDSPAAIRDEVALGRCRFQHYTVHLLVAAAYQVDVDRVLGLPSWADTDRFEVEGVSENQGSITQAQLLQMLQSLLHDRFQLKLHRTMGTVSGFELVPMSGGPRLKQNDGPTYTRYFPGVIDYRGKISVLVQMLATYLRAPVIDKTGLEGQYDVSLKWAAESRSGDSPSVNSDSGAPSLFTALQEQLHLKLQAAKVSREVLVIDSLNKPSEN
jgi:uncharacterized protein (TIGR03435 family)